MQTFSFFNTVEKEASSSRFKVQGLRFKVPGSCRLCHSVLLFFCQEYYFYLVKKSKNAIRLKGATQDSDAFGQIVEMVEPAAGELDLFKAKDGDKTRNELRIVEIEFLETLQQ